MKRRFLIHLALLLLAAMLLPMPVMAEDLMSVTAVEPAEEVFSTEEAPVPEELPEFQLVAPDIEETDNEDTGVEAAVMAATASDDADATVDVPKAATPTKLTLGVKETYTLKVSGAKKYKSSDKTIAKVSSKGVITAKKVGKATITVTDKKGTKTKIKVTVKKAPKKVTLNETKKTLKVGKTLQLTATLPSKTASNKLTWTSSDKKVAKVSSKGKVTALKAGKAKITVKTFNGKKATCTLTVKKPGYSGDIWDAIGEDVDWFSGYIDDPLILYDYADDCIYYINGYMMVSASYDDNTIKTILLNDGDTNGKYTIDGIYPGYRLVTARMAAEAADWTYWKTKDNVYFYRALKDGDTIYLAITASGSYVKSVAILM